jgi:hypothetical protein
LRNKLWPFGQPGILTHCEQGLTCLRLSVQLRCNDSNLREALKLVATFEGFESLAVRWGFWEARRHIFRRFSILHNRKRRNDGRTCQDAFIFVTFSVFLLRKAFGIPQFRWRKSIQVESNKWNRNLGGFGVDIRR